MQVEYLTHMGDDMMICNCARVSFQKLADNYSIEDNNKLIKYLAKHGHWSPFSHPQIQVRVTVPIFIANQLKRHVVGLSVNEVSRRYVDAEPTFYYPKEWRGRPEKSIKQGSGDRVITHLNSNNLLENPYRLDLEYENHINESIELYKKMIESGVAPEMARMVLPQAMNTSWIWTGSLMAFLRIYKQRSDSHAQKESQIIAQQLKEIIQPLFPVSWAAWFERETNE